MDNTERQRAIDASPWNEHADRTRAFVLGWEAKAADTGPEHLAGLRLALKHSTKYEDRQWFSFLIQVAERNGKEEKASEQAVESGLRRAAKSIVRLVRWRQEAEV